MLYTFHAQDAGLGTFTVEAKTLSGALGVANEKMWAEGTLASFAWFGEGDDLTARWYGVWD